MIENLNKIITNLKAQLNDHHIRPNENFLEVRNKKQVLLEKMRESFKKKFCAPNAVKKE